MKLALVAFCLAIYLSSVSAERIVCTFLSWTIYRRDIGEFAAKHVDPNLCTHIIYSAVGLNDDGTVHVLDDWEINGLEELKHLQSLKLINPDVKLLVSMGGWGEGSYTYSDVAADPVLRAALVKSVSAFVAKNDFDGFDLDWEWPGRRDDSDVEHDADNFVILLRELYIALRAEEYIFSASVSGTIWFITGSYPNPEAVSDNVDFLNVKSFDYHGTWETTVGHHAALYPSSLDDAGSRINNVEAGIRQWIDNGADPAKLNLGISSFGRTYTLSNLTNHALYAPSKGAGDQGPYTQEDGLLGFYEICDLYNQWTEVWDEDQLVPHRYAGDQWVAYENEKSIQEKLDFAQELGIGGVFYWSLDTDDFLGTCGAKFRLLQYINDNLQ